MNKFTELDKEEQSKFRQAVNEEVVELVMIQLQERECFFFNH